MKLGGATGQWFAICSGGSEPNNFVSLQNLKIFFLSPARSSLSREESTSNKLALCNNTRLIHYVVVLFQIQYIYRQNKMMLRPVSTPVHTSQECTHPSTHPSISSIHPCTTTTYIFLVHLTSYIVHRTSYILHLTSYILHLTRTYRP